MKAPRTAIVTIEHGPYPIEDLPSVCGFMGTDRAMYRFESTGKDEVATRQKQEIQAQLTHGGTYKVLYLEAPNKAYRDVQHAEKAQKEDEMPATAAKKKVEKLSEKIQQQASQEHDGMVGDTLDIHGAMARIQRELKPIGKERETKASSSEFRFRFRGIDDVLNALHPLFAKHGIFVLPCQHSREEYEVLIGRNQTKGVRVVVQMSWRFVAADGSFVIAGPVYGEGIDTGDKATSKAQSMAFKYALFHTFTIPTDDYQESDQENRQAQPVRRSSASDAQAMPMTEDQRRALQDIFNHPKANAALSTIRYDNESKDWIVVEEGKSMLDWIADFIEEGTTSKLAGFTIRIVREKLASQGIIIEDRIPKEMMK